MDGDPWGEWVGRDLERLIYVYRLGRLSNDRSSICEVGDRACRYHMRYTSGYEVRGRYRGPLSALYLDKVEAQKDILDKQLEAGDISEGLGSEIRTEFGIVKKRCEKSRGEM